MLQEENERRHHLKQEEELNLCRGQKWDQKKKKEYGSATYTCKQYNSILKGLKVNSIIPSAPVIPL